MNYGRLALAALAAAVVDGVYGFLGIFIGMLAVAWIYAKGYEGLAGSMALAGLVEWLIVGVVVAAVSKPAPRPGARAAGV